MAPGGTEICFLLSCPLKITRKERDTPQNNERRCSWSCQHPIAKEPASCKLQGAPAAASEESICAGELARMAQCCPPNFCSVCLCHKRHLTPHRREGVCSALLWRPDEATKTKLRGTESFLVCQMAKPPTSVQLSRLCQPNPPASQGSRALTSRASQG